ncbi:MAG: response regulator transcription factor [Flavobacteriales bacterium]|nr:response regulator transcription factor [Flavobacteriales bacterium]
MIHLVIVDDHMMIAKGIENMLADQGDIRVIKNYSSSESFLDELNELQFDIVLLDINLPGISGMEACQPILKAKPDTIILGLSNYANSTFIKNMMRSGAKGYLLKNTDKEELIEAIHTVMKGEIYLPSKLRDQLLNDSIGIHENNSFIPKLSRREQEVLNLIAEEFTSAEIAEKLFISLKTVESHRKNLHQKLNVRNSAGLIRMAIKKGLIKI